MTGVQSRTLAQPSMTPGRLISLCVDLYESFNPSATTLDIATDDFMTKNRLHDSDEIAFLKQVRNACLFKKMPF